MEAGVVNEASLPRRPMLPMRETRRDIFPWFDSLLRRVRLRKEAVEGSCSEDCPARDTVLPRPSMRSPLDTGGDSADGERREGDALSKGEVRLDGDRKDRICWPDGLRDSPSLEGDLPRCGGKRGGASSVPIVGLACGLGVVDW